VPFSRTEREIERDKIFFLVIHIKYSRERKKEKIDQEREREV
jgi:hypothetical protein